MTGQPDRGEVQSRLSRATGPGGGGGGLGLGIWGSRSGFARRLIGDRMDLRESDSCDGNESIFMASTRYCSSRPTHCRRGDAIEGAHRRSSA